MRGQGDGSPVTLALQMPPQQWDSGWDDLLPGSDVTSLTPTRPLTAIAAGLRVRAEAVGGSGREADVDAAERRAEALGGAVAAPLQLSVIRVHFQSAPRDNKGKEGSGGRQEKVPRTQLRAQIKVESSLSLVPTYSYGPRSLTRH